jgi:outer membrane protein TolC
VATVDNRDAIPRVPVAVPSQLLERRPDISAAERRMASANANIGVAEAAYYPTLAIRHRRADGQHSGALALPARPRLVNRCRSGRHRVRRGLRRANTAIAVAQYDQTVANYRQTVLGAFQEVEDNLASARVLEQESIVQNDALRSARSAFAGQQPLQGRHRSVAGCADGTDRGLYGGEHHIDDHGAAVHGGRHADQGAWRRMAWAGYGGGEGR